MESREGKIYVGELQYITSTPQLPSPFPSSTCLRLFMFVVILYMLNTISETLSCIKIVALPCKLIYIYNWIAPWILVRRRKILFFKFIYTKSFLDQIKGYYIRIMATPCWLKVATDECYMIQYIYLEKVKRNSLLDWVKSKSFYRVSLEVTLQQNICLSKWECKNFELDIKV
jgi:hypothetical protein